MSVRWFHGGYLRDQIKPGVHLAVHGKCGTYKGQVQFVNPHPFLILDVKDNSGAVQQWRLEMDNRSELTEAGITKDTLKFGDRIVVSGNPGRSQPRMMYIQKLERPADGFAYEQVGNSPRIRTRPR